MEYFATMQGETDHWKAPGDDDVVNVEFVVEFDDSLASFR